MTTMRVPSRPMLALRTIATLQLSAVIGQAGWAAAALGRGGPIPPYDPTGGSSDNGAEAAPGLMLDETYLHLHAVFAAVTLGLCIVGAVLYVALRTNGGAVNLWLAVASLVTVVAQYVLGETRVVDVHVFLGVLIAMLVTALTSWTYRHDDGEPPAFGPGATPEPGRASERGEGGARAA